MSRDLPRSSVFSSIPPHAKDGAVRHYVVEDSPGLPEYDILGELVCFLWTVFNVRHGH